MVLSRSLRIQFSVGSRTGWERHGPTSMTVVGETETIKTSWRAQMPVRSAFNAKMRH
jgi:hypothetical protein